MLSPSVTTPASSTAAAWYASVVFECSAQAIEQDPSLKGAVGLDWGVETFATLAHDIGGYTGITNPRHLRQQLDKLKHLQRSLSRKQRGSRNYHKLKKQIAALQSKIAQQRHDFLHQTSAKVVKENALIAVEKLNIKAMTIKGGRYKRGLNREILSTAPSAFHKMLRYKAEELQALARLRALRLKTAVLANTIYIEVPTRQVKPSQTCSGCGRQEKKALSERRHTCSCGLKLSRDENAARVLLNWALRQISKGRESALCGEKPLGYSLKHETPSIPIRVGGT